jgi:hypothetical protein
LLAIGVVFLVRRMFGSETAAACRLCRTGRPGTTPTFAKSDASRLGAARRVEPVLGGAASLRRRQVVPAGSTPSASSATPRSQFIALQAAHDAGDRARCATC